MPLKLDKMNAISNECLPEELIVTFKHNDYDGTVLTYCNGDKIGNRLTDNSYFNDFYRYHDVFHFTFATFLDWSPCVRNLLSCKRKSNPQIDEIEDGARAAITEEAISLIIFKEAKDKDFFSSAKVSRQTLKYIKFLTSDLEVRVKSEREWSVAIIQAYVAFRYLIKNSGGTLSFSKKERKITYMKNYDNRV